MYLAIREIFLQRVHLTIVNKVIGFLNLKVKINNYTIKNSLFIIYSFIIELKFLHFNF